MYKLRLTENDGPQATAQSKRRLRPKMTNNWKKKKKSQCRWLATWKMLLSMVFVVNLEEVGKIDFVK